MSVDFPSIPRLCRVSPASGKGSGVHPHCWSSGLTFGLSSASESPRFLSATSPGHFICLPTGGLLRDEDKKPGGAVGSIPGAISDFPLLLWDGMSGFGSWGRARRGWDPSEELCVASSLFPGRRGAGWESGDLQPHIPAAHRHTGTPETPQKELVTSPGGCAQPLNGILGIPAAPTEQSQHQAGAQGSLEWENLLGHKAELYFLLPNVPGQVLCLCQTFCRIWGLQWKWGVPHL